MQNFAARTRVGKGNKPVTYERAMNPHHIGHRKGWLSQHPCTSPAKALAYSVQLLD